MLKLSYSNGKIKKLAHELKDSKRVKYLNQVVAFDLPAGYTCPKANECLSMANRINGTITDGKACRFRCYAASTESVFKNSRLLRWHNYDLLKSCKTLNEMVDLILKSVAKAKVIRIHSSGDFFNETYFNAWLEVAKLRTDLTIFGYTKVLKYVNTDKPSNFKLVYSRGGKDDSKLGDEPSCTVVLNEFDALSPIACKVSDTDDFYLIMQEKSFSILVHGTQPKKSKAKS